jgi:hypothetical protein
MLLIKEKLDAIEMELNQLAEAVRQSERDASPKALASKKRNDIEQELRDLRDAILDVEIQVNRKTCYSS